MKPNSNQCSKLKQFIFLGSVSICEGIQQGGKDQKKRDFLEWQRYYSLFFITIE